MAKSSQCYPSRASTANLQNVSPRPVELSESLRVFEFPVKNGAKSFSCSGGGIVLPSLDTEQETRPFRSLCVPSTMVLEAREYFTAFHIKFPTARSNTEESTETHGSSGASQRTSRARSLCSMTTTKSFPIEVTNEERDSGRRSSGNSWSTMNPRQRPDPREQTPW